MNMDIPLKLLSDLSFNEKTLRDMARNEKVQYKQRELYDAAENISRLLGLNDDESCRENTDD
jgi:hypothetical protein